MIRDETKTKAVKRRPNLILPASGEHLANNAVSFTHLISLISRRHTHTHTLATPIEPPLGRLIINQLSFSLTAANILYAPQTSCVARLIFNF